MASPPKALPQGGPAWPPGGTVNLLTASQVPAEGEPCWPESHRTSELLASQVPAMGKPCSDLCWKQTYMASSRQVMGKHSTSALTRGALFSSVLQPNGSKSTGSAQAAPVGAVGAAPCHNVRVLKLQLFRTNRNNREPGTCCSWGCSAHARALRRLCPTSAVRSCRHARQQQTSWTRGAKMNPTAMESAPRCCTPSRTGQACQLAVASQVMHASISTPSLLLCISRAPIRGTRAPHAHSRVECVRHLSW